MMVGRDSGLPGAAAARACMREARVRALCGRTDESASTGPADGPPRRTAEATSAMGAVVWRGGYDGGKR